MATHRGHEFEAPLIYSLDRRGPNDPRIGSVHLVILLLIVVLAIATLLVL